MDVVVFTRPVAGDYPLNSPLATLDLTGTIGRLAAPLLIFSQSIQRKIVSVALGLIILMVITSALSMFMQIRHNLVVKGKPFFGRIRCVAKAAYSSFSGVFKRREQPFARRNAQKNRGEVDCRAIAEGTHRC